MSFGIGIGDIIKLSELAIQTWKACTSAPKEFAEVCRELDSVQKVLKFLATEMENPLSLLNRRGSERAEDFSRILANLELSLVDAKIIMARYKGLAGGSRKKQRGDGATVLERLGFMTQDLGPLREKMALHLAAITAFYDTLQSGSLARIELCVEDIRKEVCSTKSKGETSFEKQLRDAKIIPEEAVLKVFYKTDICTRCEENPTWKTCPECASGSGRSGGSCMTCDGCGIVFAPCPSCTFCPLLPGSDAVPDCVVVEAIGL